MKSSRLRAAIPQLLAILAVVFLCSCTTTQSVGESSSRDIIYVNNLTGNDDFSGRAAEPGENQSGPYKTIMQAVKQCRVGALINVANTGQDYRESVGIEGYHKGKAESPLVIDGHGACVTGLVVVPNEQWLHLRDDIYYFLNKIGDADYKPKAWYERKIGDAVYGIMPNSNWLGFRKHQGWFNEEEAPKIFFLNGKPGANVLKLEDLPPGGFFYDSQAKVLDSPAGQRCLFFRLPTDKKLADCKVELPLNRGIYVSDDYVTVRNIGSHYSQDDGFAGFWGQNVVLQNIYAGYNCDQGVSFHGNSSTLIDGALIERNAGCGIADVMSCLTVYRNITVRDNYPEGALFQGFAHVVLGGLFTGNHNCQISGGHGAAVNLENCLVVGKSAEAGPRAVSVEYGRMDHCTIVNSSLGIMVNLGFNVKNSVITSCRTNLQINKKATGNVRVSGSILSQGNVKIDNKTFADKNWADAITICPGLKSTIVDTPALAAPLYLLPENSPHSKAGAYKSRPGVKGKTGCPEKLLEYVTQ